MKHYISAVGAFVISLIITPVHAVAPTPPQHSQTAWLLADASSGDIEAAYQPELLLKPASTQKLVTTLAGALALGPDWRYQTKVRYQGKLDNGKITGDLLIDFVGDPSLSREQLQALLARSGVRSVSGDVLLNQGHFSGYNKGTGWSWNDLSVCYTAPAAALILDQNCVQGALYAKPNQAARATVPAHQPIQVSATVSVLNKTERERQFCSLDVQMSAPNQYHLTGCIGPRNTPWPLRFAIQDVDDWGQKLTQWALTHSKINVAGDIKSTHIDASNWPSLASQASPTLKELSRVILQDSNNLYTDSLLRTLGGIHFKQAGSFANGTQAVREILRDTANIDLGPAWLADGSGLSAHNLLRAQDLLAILMTISQDPRAQWLMELLPVSGKNGTLQYRRSVQGPALKGQIQAKTGTIAHVQNLAGFMTTPNGQRKAFVLLQNGLSVNPEHAKRIADNQQEPPARRFERRWLEAAIRGELIK